MNNKELDFKEKTPDGVIVNNIDEPPLMNELEIVNGYYVYQKPDFLNPKLNFAKFMDEMENEFNNDDKSQKDMQHVNTFSN